MSFSSLTSKPLLQARANSINSVIPNEPMPIVKDGPKEIKVVIEKVIVEEEPV